MGGRALKQIEKKVGGFVAKSHLLPPPSMGNRGGRAQGAGSLGLAALGACGGRERGGKEEGGVGD